ncbi:F-box/kelch-repeat protein At3g06240-like, partial [Apium graveolens]
MAKVDYINLMPVELLTCIFICMHAKSLGICKCVSKSWNSLISDPYFIKSHLNKTSITKLILLPAEPEDGRNPESERSLYSVHFDNNHSNGVASRLKFNLFTYRDNKNKNMWSRVWGSCDGLILVEDYRKFVAIVYKYEEKDAFVYIYTLKTKQWKGVESVMSGFLDNEHAAGILVGGSIYWLAANHNHSSLLIVEFNIASKEFSRLAVPNGIFDSRCRFRRLGIHEGCLCLINMNVFNTIAELWVMQGDGAIRSCIKLLIAVDGHSCFVPSIDNLVGMGFYKPFLL